MPRQATASGLVKGCAVALMLGGAMLALVNVILTPLMPADQGEEVLRTSTVYLLRLSAAGVAALFLLFGCVGIHLAQRETAGILGALAFVVTFVGTCLVVAVEWSNVFVLRAVAQTTPDALQALDESPLMAIGFAASVGLFALGWLLLAVSMLRAGVFARWIPVTILAGLIAIPALGAAFGMVGAIVGNAVLGLGIASSGLVLARAG